MKLRDREIYGGTNLENIENKHIIRISSLLICFSITFVLYFSGLGKIDISLGLIVVILILIDTMPQYHRIKIDTTAAIQFLYMIILFIPIFYSSDKKECLRILYENFISFLVLMAGTNLARKYSTDEIANGLILCGIPMAILNIIFVRFPDIESSFYEGWISELFVSPSSLDLYSSNNVGDPNKAGLWFVNANNASVYFLIFIALAIFMYRKTNKKWYIAFGLLFFVAELATGCRTGMVALVAYLLYLVYIDSKIRVSKKKIIKGIGLSLVLIVVIAIIVNSNVGAIQNTLSRLSIAVIKTDPRIIIWGVALKHLNLLGQGFGYWESISQMELPIGLKGMPQHNHLLIVMYWGGILAVILYLFFWIGNLKSGMKRQIGNQISENELLSVLAIDVIVHGMFDNYFIGHMNIILLMFLLIGFCRGKVSNVKLVVKV